MAPSATFEVNDGSNAPVAPAPTATAVPATGSAAILDGPVGGADQPIAICGMACRLPGGLYNPQALWEFLLNKGDARGKVPESRYNVDAFYDDSGRPGTVKTEYGYFLDHDISRSDGAFSSFVRGAHERQDPQQRQMSEVAREAMDDAGVGNYRGDLIGCYVGSFGEDWCEMFAKDNQQHGLYRVAGYGDFMLSNNVSYEMDLKGPSMTIRTGCSAALVGLHEAVTAIQRGDCTSAVVGGVNLIMAPGMTQAMTEQGVLSPDGSCKTFSASANGYARGEAVCAIYIKPLDAALRDGNPVRAVIKGTATNFDGRTNGISLPSTEAHEALIRQAYAKAGITNFHDTPFVECHGTGTPIGDPIEANAVARVFGGSKEGTYIGSIKPNLGHSEGASGLSSLIKTVMALENRTIPPNIKFTDPNPNIPFEERNLKVATDPVPWVGYERASVNSFGIGGANAHCILESAANYGVKPAVVEETGEPQLLLFSGNTTESIDKMVDAYRELLQNEPDKLEQVAYTLANGREHHAYRAFAVASKGGAITPSPSSKAPSKPSNVVMVFTGQGAQWPAMGLELLQQKDSVFQKTIRKLDAHLEKVLGNDDFSLERELLKRGKKSRVDQAAVSQPICTAVQLGLVDSLAAAGIKPSAVVGHSSGEIAAAYSAGALTAEEAIVVAYQRGAVAKLQKRAGAMAAVGMGWDDVQPYLEGTTAKVACENSPSSVTISGDLDAVETAIANIKKNPPGGVEVLARLLKVDKAYHSYHMAEVGQEYIALLKDIKSRSPTKDVLFYSSVSGDLLEEGQTLGPLYWQSNLENPVLFATATANILKNKDLGKPVFLEVGPHAAMGGPIRQIMAKASNSLPYASVLMRNQDSVESYLSAIGKLHQFNIPIDFKTLSASSDKTPTFLPDLPRYAWNQENSYWDESRLSKEWRFRKHPNHELLGVRIAESTELEPAWRNVFHLGHSGWIRDHIIVEDIVFPFAGYIGMAAEAVRQVSGVDAGFALRHVVVSAALVVNDDKPVELITTLRPQRLTDSLDSQWYEFTIASHNGVHWTKHCVGQVQALEESTRSEAKAVPSMARKVASRKAYNFMDQAGLCYGPHFQGLTDIRTGTVENTAGAKVLRPGFDKENTSRQSKYHLHPIVVDACLQILSLAATRGYTKKHGMVIPTLIEELKVYRTEGDVDLSSAADVSGVGAIIGSAQCLDAEGKPVLQMKGACLSPLPGQESSSDAKDTHPTARYEWAPLIDYSDAAALVKRSEPAEERAAYQTGLDELTGLFVAYAQGQLQGLETPIPHMEKYREWINSQASKSAVPEGDLLKAIEDKVASLEGTPAAAAAGPILKVASRIQTIFTGQDNVMAFLVEGDSLNQVNTLRDTGFDVSALIKQLAHAKPNLSILEVGGDTGAHTAEIIKNLVLEDGRVMYSSYNFSDSSSGMVTAAKEKFKATPNMQFTTLDIGRDLAEQNFDDKYDVIIANNVLHASGKLADGLANVRQLLRPNGRLLMTEFASTSKWMNLISGLQPWWWAGAADGRADEPYVDAKAWETALRNAGLGASAAVADAEDVALRRNNFIIARPFNDAGAEVSSKVTVLETATSDKVVPVVAALESAGYSVTRRVLGQDEIPAGEDVVALTDVNEAFFDHLDQARYDAFKALVTTVNESGARIFWVTRLAQMACEDPSYAQVLGTARTLRSEQQVKFATCEVDDLETAAKSVVDVFEGFTQACAASADEETDPDFEYSIVNGVVHVGRFAPFPLEDELLASDESGRVVLETRKPGILAALTWARREPQKLEGTMVEVQTAAAGLNFRDVLSANGIVDVPEEGFGLEASGIVSAVGPDVKHLKAGDRVFLFSRGSFSTSVTIPEDLCEKIPDGLSLEDAATMPCVYATAMYALFDIGRLQRDQRVLIHSACGGVGIAAIQLARMAGADIYVTVGNEEKVKYLMDNFQIPRERIFHSRDQSFVEGILDATGGKGVDVALNSLSGELLHATWRTIAEFGTMVEIGKRDLLGSAKLDMSVFLANRSYCCVDLDQICFKRQPLCKKLLKEVVKAFDDGYIQPIRPIEVFTAEKVREAFRYMQQGLHMGKIVIAIRDGEQNLNMDTSTVTKRQSTNLNKDASYILVGGLGGLGRAVSRWMVERNAGHLVYLSRSAGANAEDQEFIQELESMGGKVTLVKGSVSSAEDVKKAVAASPNLKGILQMSMVLRDQGWDKMTLDEWTQAASPKVQGTWNLHNATEGLDLDFFVLFSSISGVIGQPGQTNYAAANTFLDAFSLYRSSKGLPVAAIDIGAVDDVGVISNNEALRKAMLTTGAYMIKETELLEAVGAAMIMSRNAATAAVTNNFVLGLASTIPLNSPSNRALWKKDMRMAAYRNISSAEGAGDAGSDSIKTLLSSVRHDEAALKDPETHAKLAWEIGRKLFGLVLKSEDEIQTNVSLADLGMDSLVAIEMRSWWRATFGFNISMLELLGMANLEALGEHAADGLLKLLKGEM